MRFVLTAKSMKYIINPVNKKFLSISYLSQHPVYDENIKIFLIFVLITR